MFGRRVLVLTRFPLHQRQPVSSIYRYQADIPSRAHPQQIARNYATPGRPRNVVGEPSKPVKRSVKRAAAKATSTEDSPAKQKNEEKKKKAVKAKPAKPAKPKKVYTEEQKALKVVNLAKKQVADLKKLALKPPHVLYSSAYIQFVKEKAAHNDSLRAKGSSPEDVRRRLGENSKAVAAAWKECAAADVEHYNHLANTAKEQSQAEHKRWVESHTPEEIHTANRARHQLRLKLAKDKKKGTRTSWADIHDERAATRPIAPYIQFSINRHGSGDFRNIALPERAKLIAQEWKALADEEKKKYQSLFQEDNKRYQDEYSSLYGHPPPSVNGGHSPQLVAAAA